MSGAAFPARDPKARVADTPPTTGFSFWSSVTSTSQTNRLREAEDEERRRRLLGLPTDDLPDVETLTPMHLKSPPPDPWSISVGKKSSVKVCMGPRLHAR